MKKLYRDFFEHRAVYLLLILLMVGMLLTLHDGQKGADGKEYLRWAHSLAFDQDLHLLNNAEAVGGSYKLTPTGYVFERVNVGAALLWAPFYRAAALFLPVPEPATAEMVQMLWINFSSWLYPVLGGLFTFVALRRLFAPRIVRGAMIAIWLGTPVLFYTVTFPFSAHPALIFLSSLLLYLWLAEKPARLFLYYLALGVVIGWLMMVAAYNVVFGVLPGLELLRTFYRERHWPSLIGYSLAIALGVVIGFLPQMIVWTLLFGHPLHSPYSGQLLWGEPYLLETLFSPFHGLFIYAPQLLLVIPGLWIWSRRVPWRATAVGLAWLGLAIVVSVNVAWWAGSSFGNRYFLSLTPFFMLGLAALIEASIKKGWIWVVGLITLAVLWTVGLYLQLLNGVGLTTDSFVFSLTDLLRGQITAWSRSPILLPQLGLNRPWPLLPVLLPVTFALIFLILGRLVYGWARARSIRGTSWGIVIGGLLILIFFGLAGWRSEQAKAALVAQGFYEQPHDVVLRREIKELAGKAGLVTRAMYHQQTGRPEQAIADLQRAAALWKAEDAPTPQRLYLGPNSQATDIPTNLYLDYPEHVRLIGYRLEQTNETELAGSLFWEKLAGDETQAVVQPVIRAFDARGTLLGSLTLDFPFPAHYLPSGSRFEDRFRLVYTTPPETWVWLGVSLAEDGALPLDAQGEPHSGIIAAVNAATEATASNDAARLELPLGYRYQGGDLIPLQMAWPGAAARPDEGQLTVELSNAAGQPVAQMEYLLSDPRIPNNTYCFPIPDIAAPGAYQLTARLQPEGDLSTVTGERGRAISSTLDLRPADPLTSQPSLASSPTICRLLTARFARQYEPTRPQHTLDLPLTEAIRLAGYDFFIVPQVDSLAANIVLHWHALANVQHNYLVTVELLDAAGQPVVSHTRLPQNGLRPTATWLKNEWLVDQHAITIPALSPGQYQLALSLIDEQSGQPVEMVTGQTRLILQETQIP